MKTKILFRNRFKLLSLASVVALLVGNVAAAPITLERIHALPVAEQRAWQTYWERSQANARADATRLADELAHMGRTNALRAPSGGDFKLPAPVGDAYYVTPEAGQLADVILSYQTPTGGWSKHTGYSRGPRQPGMQFTSQNEPGKSPHYVATIDNRATTEELTFLAAVWQATQREDCKVGFARGLDFILAAQYPNGGWPQVYPLEGKYHDNITFNDDAMTRVLELLQDIKNGDASYAFLSAEQRQQATAALARGLDCLLRVQLTVQDKRTGWCAQYDPLTLQPAAARAMEPITLSGLESARIIKFLMTIPKPDAQLISAIESGVAWLDEVKITGLTKTNIANQTDYISAPNSTEVYWARFYSLTTGQPVFPGRDGVVYDSFQAMAANNRLGYDFFSTLPGSIVTNGQKKWRKMLADAAKK